MKTKSPGEQSAGGERREPVGKSIRWMLLMWAGGVLAAAALAGVMFSQ